MAAGKPASQGARDQSEVDEGNVVEVTFGDLAEADQRQIKEEMKKELEEVEAARLREKLACYQKTWSGVVQKADTARASASKVSTQPLPPEELAHLVDVSVASKYDTDLAHLTRVLAKDVHFNLNSFKHDLDDNLPKQIKSVVKELVGNVQGKQTVDLAGASAQQASPHIGAGATAGEHRTTQPMNPNYPQPYYQTMTYGPNFRRHAHQS
jgi:hypothetical protein